jgi:hypothetical protein
MDFRIADTFTDSLARLTGDEQKAVKTTAFDLQLNSANPGFNFHKLDKAKDRNFWSVRVNADIRLIVHKTAGSLLLCYVDHHDKAYDWAERRKLETHPATGAAQLVEIRETVKEIVVPVYVRTKFAAEPKLAAEKKAVYIAVSDDELLSYGVPAEWLGPLVTDVDGNTEDRSDTISVFNGPPPDIHILKDESEEIGTVANWIGERAIAGVMPHEFGIFYDPKPSWIVRELPSRKQPWFSGFSTSMLKLQVVTSRSAP